MVIERISYTQSATPDNHLDAVFLALADPTRRAILIRLTTGEACVGEIAAPFEISQPAISKHLKILERAGLVERSVDQQRRPAVLKADNLAIAVDWLAEFSTFWDSNFEQLDDLLAALQSTPKPNNT